MRIGSFELSEPLPELNDCHAIVMLSPWLDAGNVGSLTLERLEKCFDAQKLGEFLNPGEFFDFTRYRPTSRFTGGKRVLKIPNSRISYVCREDQPDLIFCHILEPHSFAEKYIDSLVRVLQALGVKRYCRIGAMYDSVPHTREIPVNVSINGQWTSSTGQARTQRRRRPYQGPTTIMSLVGDRLEQQGVENMTFMARLPQYLQLEDDFTGVARMLNVLAMHYHLPFEFPESDMGLRQYKQVDAELERSDTARDLVQRLESEYDDRIGTDSRQETLPLSPEVERFLQGLGETNDGPRD